MRLNLARLSSTPSASGSAPPESPVPAPRVRRRQAAQRGGDLGAARDDGRIRFGHMHGVRLPGSRRFSFAPI
jgi:hypothetical protein